MLVLSRKSQESVVVGGSGSFERMFKITVLDISRGTVKLGLRGRSRDSGPPFRGVGTDVR
jgi:sRNA-binding carbon storage regulator CsrA